MGIDFLKNFKNPWEATGEKVRNSGVLRNVVDEWAEKNQARILGQEVEEDNNKTTDKYTISKFFVFDEATYQLLGIINETISVEEEKVYQFGDIIITNAVFFLQYKSKLINFMKLFAFSKRMNEATEECFVSIANYFFTNRENGLGLSMRGMWKRQFTNGEVKESFGYGEIYPQGYSKLAYANMETSHVYNLIYIYKNDAWNISFNLLNTLYHENYHWLHHRNDTIPPYMFELEAYKAEINHYTFKLRPKLQQEEIIKKIGKYLTDYLLAINGDKNNGWYPNWASWKAYFERTLKIEYYQIWERYEFIKANFIGKEATEAVDFKRL